MIGTALGRVWWPPGPWRQLNVFIQDSSIKKTAIHFILFSILSLACPSRSIEEEATLNWMNVGGTVNLSDDNDADTSYCIGEPVLSEIGAEGPQVGTTGGVASSNTMSKVLSHTVLAPVVATFPLHLLCRCRCYGPEPLAKPNWNARG